MPQEKIELILNRRDLVAALSWVGRVLPARPTLPLLTGVRVKTDNGIVSLFGYDLEQSATATLTIKDTDLAIDWLIPGKLLSEIAKTLVGDEIHLSLEGSQVKVVSGKSVFKLNTLDASSYPTLPDMPKVFGEVNSAEFAEAIHKVAAAASKDDGLYVFTAVSLTANSESKTLSVAATDRFRLAEIRLPYTPKDDSTHQVLIASKTIDGILRSMSGESGGSSSLHISDGPENVFGITAGDRKTTTRVIDGTFPNYENLMPSEFPAGNAVFKTEAMQSALRRVALVAGVSASLTMSFKQDVATIEAGDSTTGTASEEIEIDFTGEEEFKIAFDPRHILDALNTIDSDRAKIWLVAPAKPALVTAENESLDEPKSRYLVMPKRS